MNISNSANASALTGAVVYTAQKTSPDQSAALSKIPEEASFLSDSISLSDAAGVELAAQSEDLTEGGNSIFFDSILSDALVPAKQEKIVLKGTAEADSWSISRKDDGTYDVSLNGEITNYSEEDAKRLVFNLGSGNNIFEAAGNVGIDLTVNAGNGDNRITGGAGNDTIFAGKGNNVIDGGAGNDRITAGNGHNVINGGDGNDVIKVRNGNNSISGGAGDDIINAGTGNNEIHGNDGDDIIRTAGGDSKLYGEGGNDYIEGGAGNDVIYGGDGNDVIYGLGGNDSIYGGGGNDYIDGGSGDDRIYGGAGKDILSGGRGKDVISGGAGKDVIIDDAADISDAERKSSKIYELPAEGTVGSSVKADDRSSANFIERLDSDITTLSALPSGKAILEGIDKSGHTVTVKQESDEFKNGGATAVNFEDSLVKSDGSANVGSNSKVNINPSFSLNGYSKDAAPPSVVLGHELVHAYNNATGTILNGYSTTFNNSDGTKHTAAPLGTGLYTELQDALEQAAGGVMEKAGELQAVGLPMNAENLVHIDFVDNGFGGSFPNINEAGFSAVSYPDGTVSLNNPEGISENALRNDLGLAPRQTYGR